MYTMRLHIDVYVYVFMYAGINVCM